MCVSLLWIPLYGRMDAKADLARRTVESNLVILCGGLPTLRIFIKHVVSKNRKGNARNQGASNGKGLSLRTFGKAGRSRRQFDTIAEIDAIDNMDVKDDAHDSQVTADARTANSSSLNGSEVAIVQKTSPSATGPAFSV